MFTEKQTQLIRIFKQSQLKRINLLEGSVRSGKTWISLVLWALWVATMPKDGEYLMVAKTLTSLSRNCLNLLESLVGSKNFTYSTSKKEGRLFGRLIYLEGVNDARAESKIRGMTLTGAYCDEATLFTEDFFTMLLSRLSEKNAKLFATTNPDSPNHWLMIKYINRQDELDMMVMKFLIDDNTFLDPEYVKQLKIEYTGVFYDRFILGLWKVAEGLIFRNFSDDPDRYILKEIPPDIKIKHIMIGVDFGGNKSKTTFVATGFVGNYQKLIVLDDYKMKGEKGTIDPDRLNKEFIEFVQRVQQSYPASPILYAWCDNEAQTLINGMKAAVIKARLPIKVVDCNKATIIERIYTLNGLINTGRFFVMSCCKHVIKSLQEQVWDQKKEKDERLDDGTCDIDTADALEYSFSKFLKAFALIGVKK
jgi:PBSX family phage terminase large subunit